jgi:mono/diheme cytochrome c family protein
MENQERKYIRIYRMITLAASLILIILIVTVWVRESQTSEWRKIQNEFAELIHQKDSISNSRPEAERINYIRQMVLEDLGRTDRCITCHLGIEDQQMEGQEQPHATHSGDLLIWHPSDNFGCTICHGGQGRATTKTEAFGQNPETHWDTPLLGYPYIQSSCGKCHAVIFSTHEELEGTEVFLKGQAIFNQEGCLGCHRARGVGGTVGPDLTRQGEKTKHEYSFQNIRGEQTISNWLKEHFRDPEMVSRGSRMLKIDLPEEDLDALVTFIMGLAMPEIPFIYLSVETLNEHKGIRSKLTGQQAFDFCCSACHGKRGEGKDYLVYKTGIPALANRDFTSTASEDFIRFTILNGRGRREMASWLPWYSGLSEEEIDSIVTHIRSQRIVNTVYQSFISLQGNATDGQAIFRNHCEICHGNEGSGGLAPAINNRDFLRFAGDRFIYLTITEGRNNTAMPSWSCLTDRQMADLVACLRSSGGYEYPSHIQGLTAGDKVKGELQFHYLCSRCHGISGEGDTGPAILNNSFLSAAEDSYLYRTITEGRSHTAMFGWATPLTGQLQLGKKETSDIIAYMRSFQNRRWNYIHPGSNPGDKAAGRHIFEEHCAECHGLKGEGAKAPALNNQEFLNSATNGYLVATISLGREGTRMPSWGRGSTGYPALTGKERGDVTAFIRSWQKVWIRYGND